MCRGYSTHSSKLSVYPPKVVEGWLDLPGEDPVKDPLIVGHPVTDGLESLFGRCDSSGVTRQGFLGVADRFVIGVHVRLLVIVSDKIH